MTNETTPPEAPSLYAQAGGEVVLRAVLRTFYDKVFDDVMIGFHFWKADKERLIDKEFEFAARMLGATDVTYTGKTIREAHAPHPILGGQFERRLVILIEAMDAHGLPDNVKEAWIAHTNSLRHLVTPNQGSGCIHEELDVNAEEAG